MVPFCFLFGPHVHVSLTDTQSLNCNFIVKTRTSDWYNNSQCSVDGDDNDSKAFPLSDREKEIMSIKECADLPLKLRDIGEELKKQLHLMEKEAVLTKGPHTLQVSMISQYRQGKVTVASCNFTLDGEYSFYFNAKNKEWGVIHDKVRVIKEKLENNRDLANDLSVFSMGDSRSCHKKLKAHRKETSSK
ncbi:histocompatibility antigen 60b-like [Sigmodon hispidus]